MKTGGTVSDGGQRGWGSKDICLSRRRVYIDSPRESSSSRDKGRYRSCTDKHSKHLVWVFPPLSTLDDPHYSSFAENTRKITTT